MGYVDSEFGTNSVLNTKRSTGLVSQQVIPYAKSILGVDISQGMVDLYNETGKKEGFEGMKAVLAHLKGEEGELDGRKFDLILVSSVRLGGVNTPLNLALV